VAFSVHWQHIRKIFNYYPFKRSRNLQPDRLN
jgi:hypothetical protein